MTATKMANPPRVRSVWSTVGSTAGAKVIVMGLSGVLGLITSRLIIQNFGTDIYAQYGLLTSFPSLLPFADLGMAAVVINAVAASDDVKSDRYVRNSITTAFRILLVAGLIILVLGLIITLAGWWPTLLGNGITSSGPMAAFLCLAVFGVVLPLTVGQRVMVGLHKTTQQVATQAVVAPFMLLGIGAIVLLAVPAGGYIAVVSYLASSLVSIICLVLAARAIKPQMGRAIREIPRLRSVPSLPVLNLAWPQLVQMIALPIAMQTDRLLLSHLTTGPELAQYNVTSQLFGMVLQAIAAGGIALWPIFARARSTAEVRSPMKPTLWFVGVSLLLAGGLALLSPWIAEFISDGKIELDPWLVGGFVGFVVMQAAKYPLGMYMTDKKGLRFQVPPILVLVPLNLAISYWLIGVIGAGGPIIGSAIAVFLCQVIPNYVYVRRDLRRRTAAAALATQEEDHDA